MQCFIFLTSGSLSYKFTELTDFTRPTELGAWSPMAGNILRVFHNAMVELRPAWVDMSCAVPD